MALRAFSAARTTGRRGEIPEESDGYRGHRVRAALPRARRADHPRSGRIAAPDALLPLPRGGGELAGGAPLPQPRPAADGGRLGSGDRVGAPSALAALGKAAPFF